MLTEKKEFFNIVNNGCKLIIMLKLHKICLTNHQLVIVGASYRRDKVPPWA